ncbi:hypothetical protein JY651_00990 [Pyxidicoccus parkwayensis]|uniref:Uncharacterized protein n=1 Tax=Pyxidicoccus parkwayensis TaxID=2813578 RepID=A0ABX7NYP2_9BACT|nr:hypothetical protein [Pyxidicoccus parkwaysis]QSQ23593.1 hypothetical protein JY651_00990 [Pyxidicoccus parkwaysis]
MRAYPLLALLFASAPAAAAVPTGCQEDYATCKEDCAIEHGGSGRAIKQLTECLAQCQDTLDHCANRHSSLKDLPPGVADDEPRPSRKSGTAKKPSKKDSREVDPWADEAAAPKRSHKDDPYGDTPSSNSEGGATKRESYRASEAPREEVPPPPDAPRPRGGAQGSRATSGRADAEEMVTGSSGKRSGYRASDAEPEPEKSLGLEGLEPLDEKPEPAPVAKSGAKGASAKSAPAPAREPVKTEPEKPAASASTEVEKKDPLLDEEPAVLPAPPPSRKPATATTKAPHKPTPAPEPKKDISDWDPNGD